MLLNKGIRAGSAKGPPAACAEGSRPRDTAEAEAAGPGAPKVEGAKREARARRRRARRGRDSADATQGEDGDGYA